MPSPPRTLVKICGLSTPETVEAALAAGADMVGFVRFPRSPRHVELDVGRELSALARGHAERVLLVVDPDDAALDSDVAALDPDLIQLHGREVPERVAQIRERFGRPVMKAVGIATRADLPAISRYRDAADRILLDSKASPGAALPGGNGVAFDWRLLVDGELTERDVLSGGLNQQNVAEAISMSGLRGVDVSSGVERMPGEKDPRRIVAFIHSARRAFAEAAGKVETVA